MAGEPTKNCPKCGGVIHAAAIRCKHCKTDLLSPWDPGREDQSSDGIRIRLVQGEKLVASSARGWLGNGIENLYIKNEVVLTNKRLHLCLRNWLGTASETQAIPLDRIDNISLYTRFPWPTLVLAIGMLVFSLIGMSSSSAGIAVLGVVCFFGSLALFTRFFLAKGAVMEIVAGKSVIPLRMRRDISALQWFVDAVIEEMDRYRSEYGSKGSPAQPSPSTASTMDRLKELQELLEAGMITQAEYDEKRAKLLDEL